MLFLKYALLLLQVKSDEMFFADLSFDQYVIKMHTYIIHLLCSSWLLNLLLLHSPLFSTPLRSQDWFFRVRPEHCCFAFSISILSRLNLDNNC